MTVHLQKLSVGSQSVQTLAAWQARTAEARAARGEPPLAVHVTRMFPRRKDEIIGGGSIYWVIKGRFLCRNRIVDLQPVTREDGVRACAIMMEPVPVPVVPTPRRPFQGWRYLSPADIPPDLSTNADGQNLMEDIPDALRDRLSQIGVW